MSEKITTLIIDDEKHARETLARALESFEQIKIIGECENGVEAIKTINETKPQLIFLDIQMPKLDGFDVIELLDKDPPLVVFLTAHDEFAIRAFENNALDYLLKPLDSNRLEKTIKRVNERLSSGDALPLKTLTFQHQQELMPLRRILVREKSEVHVLSVEDIFYIESADDYIAIHLKEATHIKLDSLQNLEKLLNPHAFCRVHRSHLIHLKFLSSIESETKDNKVALLQNGARIPISRSGYSRLKTLL